MRKPHQPEDRSCGHYFLQLGLDTMLLLFPVIVTIYLMGSGEGRHAVNWWLISLGFLVFSSSIYRIVTTLIRLIIAFGDRRWWWLCGAVIRLTVLGICLYLSGIFLLILLGAGVSVGEPMG